MIDVLQHGQDMVLDIAQIQGHFMLDSSNLPGFIFRLLLLLLLRRLVCVALDETADDVCLGSQKPQELHHGLAATANPSEHIRLFRAAQDQDQIVNRIDLQLGMLDQRRKAIRDVVNQRIVDPLGCDVDKVFELVDPLAHVVRMRDRLEMEREHARLEDDNVEVDGLEVIRTVDVVIEAAETDEHVVRKDLAFLAGFLSLNILGCQGMDAKNFADRAHFSVGRRQNIDPPVARVLHQISDGARFLLARLHSNNVFHQQIPQRITLG